MKLIPHSTQELIRFIERSDYTDIIFDFDVTLYHLIVDWTSFKKKMAIHKEESGFGDYTGNLHEMIVAMLEDGGTTQKKLIDAMFLDAETHHLKSIDTNEGLIDFIKNNAGRYSFHIVSNNMEETITSVLEAKGMKKYFQHIYGRQSTLFSKPNPEGLEMVVSQQGTDKNNFLMVGDNADSDIEAANRAGIDSYLIDMYL